MSAVQRAILCADQQSLLVDVLKVYNGQQARHSSTTRARSDGGFLAPKLEEGLSDTCNWKENRNGYAVNRPIENMPNQTQYPFERHSSSKRGV